MSAVTLAVPALTTNLHERTQPSQCATPARTTHVLAVVHPHAVLWMREQLHHQWYSTVLGNAGDAREALKQTPDILLLDGQLAFPTLVELCRVARQSNGGNRLAILLLIDPCMSAQQLDVLDVDAVLPRTSNHIELFWWVTILVRTQRFTSLPQQAAVERLIAAIHAKDTIADGHLERIEHYAMIIGRKVALPPATLCALRYGALLHDVGKVGIAETLLSKPARLTPGEYQNIQQHPVIGAKIIQHLMIDPLVVQTVRHHHERWDGGGYPDGLRGNCIPLCARIVAVADAFDAMTSKRPYSTPRSRAEAIVELRQGRSTWWDPHIVDVFTRWLEKARPSTLSSTSAIGQVLVPG